MYPQETFQPKKYKGLQIMTTKDKGLIEYLANVTGQMAGELVQRGRAGEALRGGAQPAPLLDCFAP